MQIQTLTIVTGTTECNANCPYCVSKMTPKHNIDTTKKICWRNFHKACRLAQIHNVSTVLFTGKGEPTLYPLEITDYLHEMGQYNFPMIELQTNGIRLENMDDRIWQSWYLKGLTTIAMSMIPGRIISKVRKICDRIHSFGFSVRLNFIMSKNRISRFTDIENTMELMRDWKVEQTTFTPVRMPKNCKDLSVKKWIIEHELSDDKISRISEDANRKSTKLMTLPHGAVVYDYRGQNLCISNCLTVSPNDDNLRNLIFFQDGHLRYDWQYSGAILL